MRFSKILLLALHVLTYFCVLCERESTAWTNLCLFERNKITKDHFIYLRNFSFQLYSCWRWSVGHRILCAIKQLIQRLLHLYGYYNLRKTKNQLFLICALP